MARGTVHIIGAGLAGLSAATLLAERGWPVCLHEAAPQAGGRCRSYVDPTLDTTIDNGNHLILSGNQAALAYLQRIGARDRLSGPDRSIFDFVDLENGERWQLEPSPGRLPFWIFDKARRVPGTRWTDYLGLLRLQFARDGATIGDALSCRGLIYDRLWRPLLLAALNIEPPSASARLAGAVIRQTLARGGDACRPLTARGGLSSAFVDPALAFLKGLGARVRFGTRLRSITLGPDRAEGLIFADDRLSLEADDHVILAVPGLAASQLLPRLTVPVEHCAIVNGHFRIAPPASLPPILGVIGGQAEWIFAFSDHISTTTSGADRLLDVPREELASTLWRDIQAATGLDAAMPSWQIVKERRATFAALPAEEKRRPPAKTKWSNILLAGDYTATGLPATIEGAIRSGVVAADMVRQLSGRQPAAAAHSQGAIST
ncbi:hypothetical protein GCM10007874_42310 [Labrys miyagiensis]|uniref:Amine oxidase domain-containing protein n=1 Tax=Labrys miyagiensis TaxID=346912 RepID=A0ABQ6CNB9_9HYPH|nr:hydroxysqualene dehydroxylase HpnE [Labrys miyagiensis]GLS21214.1 hypothetical protein GCM10007874_42310 [Labrys miyagiensis]